MSTTTKEESSSKSTELKIVSLLEWWNDASWKQRIPLLDVRSQNDYNEKWLHSPDALDSSTKTPSTTSTTPNATSSTLTTIVHIPFTELEERSYELPPRHVVFTLLTTDASSIVACQELLLLGGERRRQKPWLVPYAILASDPDNWQQAASLGLVKCPLHQPSLSPFRAMQRLWEPDPMVAQVLLPVLLQNSMLDKDMDVDDDRVVETSEIWDLGAGSGRDVCFLAEQLREQLCLPASASESELTATTNININIKVVGLDQRYQEAVAANEECNRFWKRRGVGYMTACRRIRLEDWDEFSGELQRTRTNGRVLCLFAVRFWNRLLVERLVNSPMIAPGTIFAISQFGKPSPDATWDFAHPKVRNTELVFLVDTTKSGRTRKRYLRAIYCWLHRMNGMKCNRHSHLYLSWCFVTGKARLGAIRAARSLCTPTLHNRRGGRLEGSLRRSGFG